MSDAARNPVFAADNFPYQVAETSRYFRGLFLPPQSASSIKGAKFKKDFKEKEHPAKLYTIEYEDYSTIGEVKVDRIEVKTYKNLIYEILVITEKDERLMKGMEKALGKPIYNVRDESYNWVGEKASLKFKSHSKAHLELLYNSTVMHTMMREDKAKKIDDIADDF
jgi:hypothetical protein